MAVLRVASVARFFYWHTSATLESMKFELATDKTPAGDQPQAIEKLIKGLEAGADHQTLLGVTGSGKTFTVANVINAIQKPTLVIAHNKTLAAQLAQEYRDFFPNNAVHYFVSYYDYYQPEAYMPVSDTYIEKEAQINKEIDRLRHASTQALLTRRDVIIVASVSCIYGLGSPAEYEKVHKKIEKGFVITRTDMLRLLVSMYFERTNADLSPGNFRAVGNTVEVMPTNEKVIYRLSFTGDTVSGITKIDATTRAIIEEPETFFLFPAKHFVTPEAERARAMEDIKLELDEQLKKFKKEGKLLESERLKRRTEHDLALIREIGYCNGIENYSRHFDGRQVDEPPYTLLDYFPHKSDGSADFLTIIDESHVTIPQIGGMYAGDRARKDTLVEFGFRLPSAKDNRPLKFAEFEARVGQRLYTSATPGKYEYEKAETTSFPMVEQIIRPTGLVDPEIDLRPVVERGNYPGQVKDFIDEAVKVIGSGARVLTTVLTKQMAEDLAEFLGGKGIKTKYIHSDVETLERIEILTDFRKGVFDCLVGVNLLREGLDLPEVELVAILDADKTGFLRSETALIQTIGRAARNVNGRVVLYADEITPALKFAIGETNRRREKQLAYNQEHGITPQTIKKEIKSIADQLRSEHEETVHTLLSVDMELFKKNPTKVLKEKRRQMNDAVAILDFETAAIIRDEMRVLEESTKKKKT
jgi:excinuclease ABC subunit B